jgi:hypothetical protein
MSKLGKFTRLSGAERRLFLEAVFWCAVVRLTMLLVPFRKYASLLGTPQEESPSTKGLKHETNQKFFGGSRGAPRARRRQLKQIGAAIRRASRNVPWETRCFVEAIAAKRMLKRRNIPCTIYLGLKKIEIIENGEHMEDMDAHAWVDSGDFVVTGGQGVKLKQYTVVSTFQ